MTSREKHVCELSLYAVAGSSFYARIEGIQARDNGQFVCRITLNNITEQKRAEDNLRQSELKRLQYESDAWKQLALDAGQFGAFDQDLQTGRITCSAHAYAMFGFPPGADIDWESLTQRIHAGDRAAFSDEMQNSTEPYGTHRCEVIFRVIMPDGSVHWLRFAARTYFDERTPPRPIRRMGVVADITNLKRAEELLRSRSEELDARVRERTAKLQEAVNDLEHLSYTLVHDLRAPLRAIAGYTNLLNEQLKDIRCSAIFSSAPTPRRCGWMS